MRTDFGVDGSGSLRWKGPKQVDPAAQASWVQPKPSKDIALELKETFNANPLHCVQYKRSGLLTIDEINAELKFLIAYALKPVHMQKTIDALQVDLQTLQNTEVRKLAKPNRDKSTCSNFALGERRGETAESKFLKHAKGQIKSLEKKKPKTIKFDVKQENHPGEKWSKAKWAEFAAAVREQRYLSQDPKDSKHSLTEEEVQFLASGGKYDALNSTAIIFFALDFAQYISNRNRQSGRPSLDLRVPEKYYSEDQRFKHVSQDC